MRLCNAGEIMALDRQAIQGLGVPGVVLMENAGRSCCDLFEKAFSQYFPGPVLILAGKGNNGGDGYVMARILAERGWQVSTLVLGLENSISGDAGVMLNIVRQLELPITFVENIPELQKSFAAAAPALIVDAIFGTGLSSDVVGKQAAAINLMNESVAPVFAVDIPSGVDSSTGRICGLAVQSTLTATFDHAKIGHASYPGARYVGDLKVVDIGIPQAGRQDFSSHVHLLDVLDAQALLPDRSFHGHKGTFGHLLIVAGSPGKTGAAALAGNAAARSGCGLVTVAVPDSVHDIIEVKLTEAMSCALPSVDGLICLQAKTQIEQLITARQGLAIGPGLGQSSELSALVRSLVVSASVPIVIDADGISLLSGQLECLQGRREQPLILTPHPGEMSRLTGLSVAEIEANRYVVAQEFAAKHGVVLLLKGARTVIAAPDGRVNINATGNDGLSSGGSGDVLTGLIGGLLAQGLDGFSAASLGAWLHGRAAELVSATQGTAGMIASDILCYLPVARQELVKGV
ncbi:NAD(P)H-hydrate dehydratase [uncultured Desulfuromusa sp.]|uniref:NAD(P)H-hydrate dehydratase n=1 Tax=uncultured Desulfuromusa sp. TaxID=219183 RepID=UPI002AA7215E|nr:NAD(P)H-hydrate dehydratase [uncultured Desulfuromusa sp.]